MKIGKGRAWMAISLLFAFVIGCTSDGITKSEAIKISKETDQVKDLLKFDPEAKAEVREDAFHGTKCWRVDWYSTKVLNPDAPVHQVYVDMQTGKIIDILSTR